MYFKKNRNITESRHEIIKLERKIILLTNNIFTVIKRSK